MRFDSAFTVLWSTICLSPNPKWAVTAAISEGTSVGRTRNPNRAEDAGKCAGQLSIATAIWPLWPLVSHRRRRWPATRPCRCGHRQRVADADM